MATRKAIVSAVHADGSFDILFYGPQLLQGIDAKNFIARVGDPVPSKGQEVDFEYSNGRFVILPKS